MKPTAAAMRKRFDGMGIRLPIQLELLETFRAAGEKAAVERATAMVAHQERERKDKLERAKYLARQILAGQYDKGKTRISPRFADK